MPRIWLRSTLDSTDSIKCLAHRADNAIGSIIDRNFGQNYWLGSYVSKFDGLAIVTRIRAFQLELQFHRIVATYNLDKENNT